MNSYLSPGLVYIPEYGNYLNPADPGEGGYAGSPPRRSVTDEEAEILADLAIGLRVLEIGTGLGVSTRALASTATKVFTVDPDPWVTDPGLPNVEFSRVLPSQDAMRVFDFAFIDGHHSTESVVRDIISCRNISQLVLHDTYIPEVMAAIRMCGLIECKAFPTVCRLAVYQFA